MENNSPEIDVFEKDGKIDVIKFAKVMAKIHKSNEKDELKAILDWLGVKYIDLVKKDGK